MGVHELRSHSQQINSPMVWLTRVRASDGGFEDASAFGWSELAEEVNQRSCPSREAEPVDRRHVISGQQSRAVESHSRCSRRMLVVLLCDVNRGVPPSCAVEVVSDRSSIKREDRSCSSPKQPRGADRCFAVNCLRVYTDAGVDPVEDTDLDPMTYRATRHARFEQCRT
jgi:hypothetical protein